MGFEKTMYDDRFGGPQRVGVSLDPTQYSRIDPMRRSKIPGSRSVRRTLMNGRSLAVPKKVKT